MMKAMRRKLICFDRSGLPTEYLRKEYIMTAYFGDQYINVGVTCDEVYVEASAPAVSDSVIRYLLCNKGYNDYEIGLSQYTGRIYGFDSSMHFDSTKFSFRAKTDGNKFFDVVYNGEPKQDTTYAKLYIDEEICIFGNAVATIRYLRQAKLYCARLYKNGSLVADLVPCLRVADNVAGLYDLKRKVFLENAGSGSFSYG